MNEKRQRQINWSAEEKESLFQMVKERKGIVEAKKGLDKEVLRKDRAWQEIFEEFSAKHGHTRSVQKLREQWKRMKTQAKKRISLVIYILYLLYMLICIISQFYTHICFCCFALVVISFYFRLRGIRGKLVVDLPQILKQLN